MLAVNADVAGKGKTTGSTGGSGGGTTETTSTSTTSTSTQGESYSQSVTRASGQVNAATQAGYDRTQAGYTQSDVVTQAYNRLQQVLNNQPGPFSSEYESTMQDLYNKIMNREEFSYNIAEDPTYALYRERYTAMGQQAMKDTMAQSAAATGGYASSQSQAAGQAQYNAMLQQLAEMAPQLRQTALDTYNRIGDELNNKMNLTKGLYDQDYQMYRDKVSDWQTDRGYYTDAYDNERSFDYNKYVADRAYFAQEYWNQRNAEHTTDTNTSSWSNTTSTTNTSTKSKKK